MSIGIALTYAYTYSFFLFWADVSLESPVKYKGHLVKGKKAAVAVEAEQCSNVGVDSKSVTNNKKV